ncbi:MAG: hypothetical protein AB1638_07370, partial [Nitrospirota bacterium]
MSTSETFTYYNNTKYDYPNCRVKYVISIVDRKIELTPDRHLKLTPLNPIISFLEIRKEERKRGVKHVQVA